MTPSQQLLNAFANVAEDLLAQAAEEGLENTTLNPHVIIELLDADGNVVLRACDLVDFLGGDNV